MTSLLLRFALVVSCFVFLLGTAQGQPLTFYNTTFVDTLNPTPEAGRYSALWGYTAPDGREYALLGGYTGTHIIDITSKPIVQVAFIPGPSSGWREMKTFGRYAYVVSEGGGGLQIIDLGNLPDTAILIKADQTVFRTGHTINQEGSWLYVNGTNVDAGANQGTLIFDIATDPLNPKLVGKYTRGYVHDEVVRNDTMYAAMINDGRFDIVYLGKDRTNPELVTDISYPGAGTHNADLTIDGRYVMTTDEIGSTPKTLKVWDLANIDDIVKVADWTPVQGQTIHNVHVKGTVAYIAWYTAGTRIVDISDPTSPVEIGFYDMFPGSSSSTIGNWEVYPYFKSGKIISSDMRTGLHVFTFDGAKKGVVNGIVKDSASGQPLADVVIDLPELGRSVRTDNQGHFQVLAAEGESRYAARLLNYHLKEGTFTLSSDGTSVEILLSSLPLRSVRIVPVDANSGTEIMKFVYNVQTRGEGKSDGNTLQRLPIDSSYTIQVGAWGWFSRSATIPVGFDGDFTIRMERGYSDNAELDLGWTFGAPGDETDPSGKWERGKPVEFQLHIPNEPPATLEPGEDHTPGEGTKAFITGIGDDPDQLFSNVGPGRSTLTSPEFDLTSYSDPHLSFWLWYVNQAFSFMPKDDRLYIRLSNNGGDTWEDVLTLEDGMQEWTEYQIRVADYMTPTAMMKFRVVAADSGESGWVEAGLDDFLVSDTGTGSVVLREGKFAGVRLQVNPNPFTGEGGVRLSLPNRLRNIQVEVLDLFGRPVATLYRGDLPEGESVLPIKVEKLMAGPYYVRLLFDDGTSLIQKIALVK